MFWSKNKKKVSPCKPQFYYIKVGCNGVFVTRTCFRDDVVNVVLSSVMDNIFYLSDASSSMKTKHADVKVYTYTRVVRKVRGLLLLKTQMCLILISITVFH